MLQRFSCISFLFKPPCLLLRQIIFDKTLYSRHGTLRTNINNTFAIIWRQSLLLCKCVWGSSVFWQGFCLKTCIFLRNEVLGVLEDLDFRSLLTVLYNSNALFSRTLSYAGF